MTFISRVLLKTALNAGGLYLASQWVSGFEIAPRSFLGLESIGLSPLVQSLVAGGLVLALLNSTLRPILRLISFPLIILTFGLFHIVINLAVLYLADASLAALTIASFKALFVGSFIIGVVNAVI